MLKRLFFLTGLVLLLHVRCFSQDEEDKFNFPFSIVLDFYTENNTGARVWGMGGAGVANVNDLTAMVVNPGAFNFENRFELYSEVLNKSNTKFLKGEDNPLKSDDYLKSQVIIPDFIGFGYKFNDRFKIGFGYSSPKYIKLDFGKCEVEYEVKGFTVTDTVDQYYILHNKQGILIFNYNFKEVVYLGLNLNKNFIFYDLFWNSVHVDELDIDYWNLKFGILAKMHEILSFEEEEVKIDLGFTYTPQKRIKTDDKSEKTNYPGQLEIGFKVYNLPFPVDFASDIKFYDNSKVKGLEDRWDIHLGCEWEAKENLAFQFGYFTRFDYRKPEGSWSGEGEDYEQHFLTTGVRLSYERYLVQFSIRDSHLLSSGFIKTTQLSFGGGIGF